MKEKQKIYEKGITLIALVITIIVLLILAGVTLSIVFNGGIINKSQTAVDKYSEESAREKLSLATFNYKMGVITGEAGEGKKTFNDYVTEIRGTAVYNESEKTYTVIIDGYKFTVKDITYEIISKGKTTGEETPVTPEVKKYTVTINKGTGIESVTASQQVEEGKSLDIEAMVSNGYIFSKWNITSGTGTIENENSATTKITPAGDITIEATAGKQMAKITNGNNLTGNANGTLNGKFAEYNNPVIPVGFRTSNEGASWSLSADGTYVTGWNDGLVIEDAETGGNQFVWVPVDGTNVTYDYHYSKGSTGNTSLEESLPTGISSEDTQITTYKGFYIARYEAGIPETLTSAISNTLARDTSGIPVSKKNQVPWNYISWSKAKENAQNMYKLANTNNHVQSTLITDRMWETTMQWLEKANINVASDSRSWGNYKDAAVTGITEYSGDYGESWTKVSSTTKGTSTMWLLKTGHTDYTKIKNIYDLAGNLWEWTNAKYSSFSDYITRGGSYGSNGRGYPAAYRNHISDTGNKHLGFRVGLFVQ